MTSAGIGVAICSWWGRAGVSSGDSQGVLTDDALVLALDAAVAAGGNTRVALHLEPYAGRSVESVRGDLEHLLGGRVGSHAGLYRDDATGRPLVFVYDSYHQDASAWSRLLRARGDLSVRGGPLDADVIGLWLHAHHGRELADGGFDGAYTYFASPTQSYGSNPSHWPSMAAEAAKLHLSFIPSVGPGYDDSKIRPWNAAAVIERRGGLTYAAAWEAALAVSPAAVSITSFNEWGEGTQIEPATPRAIDVERLAPQGLALPSDVRTALRLRRIDAYEDYGEGGEALYLDLTRAFAERLEGGGEGREREGDDHDL